MPAVILGSIGAAALILRTLTQFSPLEWKRTIHLAFSGILLLACLRIRSVLISEPEEILADLREPGRQENQQ